MADLGTDIIRIHLVNGDARTVRFEEGADSSVSGDPIVNSSTRNEMLTDVINITFITWYQLL